MEGRPAIDFAVVDMNGKEGKLSDYKGKGVVCGLLGYLVYALFGRDAFL